MLRSKNMDEKIALRFSLGNFIKPEDDNEWIEYLAGRAIFKKLLKIADVKYAYYNDISDYQTHIIVEFNWPNKPSALATLEADFQREIYRAEKALKESELGLPKTLKALKELESGLPKTFEELKRRNKNEKE
jgi:hypothetical protein